MTKKVTTTTKTPKIKVMAKKQEIISSTTQMKLDINQKETKAIERYKFLSKTHH